MTTYRNKNWLTIAHAQNPIYQEIENAVLPSQRVPGCFDSDSVCAAQGKMRALGFHDVTVFKSIYGWSVVSIDNMQTRTLMFGLESRQAAIDWAIEWQKEDAQNRQVAILAILDKCDQ